MRSFFNKFRFRTLSDSRFDRYYFGVLGSGSGVPTADEARRDLRKFDSDRMHIGMLH